MRARMSSSGDDDELYPDHRFDSRDERQAAIDRLSPPKEPKTKEDEEEEEDKRSELKFVKKVESLRGSSTSNIKNNKFGKLSSSLPPERPKPTRVRNVGLTEREKNRAVRREDPELGPSA